MDFEDIDPKNVFELNLSCCQIEPPIFRQLRVLGGCHDVQDLKF